MTGILWGPNPPLWGEGPSIGQLLSWIAFAAREGKAGYGGCRIAGGCKLVLAWRRSGWRHLCEKLKECTQWLQG